MKSWKEEIICHIDNNFVLKCITKDGEKDLYNFIKWNNGTHHSDYDNHFGKFSMEKFKEFAKKSIKQMRAVRMDEDGSTEELWQNYLIRMKRKKKLAKLLS